jgi:hypothetical protein
MLLEKLTEFVNVSHQHESDWLEEVNTTNFFYVSLRMM